MKPWSITWGAETWTHDRVLGGHVIAVCDLLEEDAGFEVSPWDGPKQLAAWIAVLLASSRFGEGAGLAEDVLSAALIEVYASPADALLTALSLPRPVVAVA